MSTPELLWSAGLVAALFVGLQLLRRVRRRTTDYRESAALKARLPPWVRQFEALVLCAFVAAGAVGVVWLLFRVLGPNGKSLIAMTGPSAIYMALGAISISAPLGALGANAVSWLLPPVRDANLRAMTGSQISFWSQNRGLLRFSAVSVPLGLLILTLAVLAPWRP